MSETRSSLWRTRIDFIILALVLGALVGAIVWLFLFLMNAGLTVLWQMLPAAVGWRYLPIVVCVAGGAVLGFYERTCGAYPESLDAAMAEVKETGGYAYGKGRLLKGAIGALLPLVFGGSIGPEAGLTGTVAGLCTWVGDHLHSAGRQAREFTTMGISATLTALFNAPLFGLVAPFENAEGGFEFTRMQKIVSYLASVIGGMATMTGLKYLFGGGMALPRFETFAIASSDVVWVVPFALAGVAMGYLYFAADRLSERVSSLFGPHPELRAMTCGLIVGCAGVCLPLAMFAGESQAETIIEGWAAMGATMLAATGIVKTCLTPYCIRNGWRGGNIFPLIFSGICIGYSLAFVTGATPGLAVCTVVASLCGTVMRKPLGVVALMLLCFPIHGILFLVIGAFVGAKLPLPRPLRPAGRTVAGQPLSKR